MGLRYPIDCCRYRLVAIGEILSKSLARTLQDLAQGPATVDLRLLDELLDL
jgi:hypothetical protein